MTTKMLHSIRSAHAPLTFVLLVATALLMGCGKGHDHDHDHSGHAHQYTCPMKEHADVVSDKPGNCSKCGMKLVEKK